MRRSSLLATTRRAGSLERAHYLNASRSRALHFANYQPQLSDTEPTSRSSSCRHAHCSASPLRDASHHASPYHMHLRPYSSSSSAPSSSSSRNDNPSTSSTTPSPLWDSIFDGVDIAANAAGGPVRRSADSYMPVPGAESSSSSKSTADDESKFPRRQSLTLQESAIFNELFEKIFANTPKRTKSPGTRDPLSNAGIGLKPGEARHSVDALFGKLRRRSRRYHDPTESHLIVEQQRHVMESCSTDRELLDWAIKNVFNSNNPDAFPAKVPAAKRSTRHAAAAAGSSTAASASPAEASELLVLQSPATASSDSETTSSTSTAEDEDEQAREFALQSSVYPHMLASLIALFRDKFRDPHTALSIFAAARHLSVASYVFGCTTAVYNELLATRWTAFHDLEGVVEALNEMRTNGVFPDDQTRRIGLRVKREAMAQASATRSPLATLPPSLTHRFSIDASDDMMMTDEQSWPDVPVDHPTRFLLAQMDQLISPPESFSRSSVSSTAAGGWKARKSAERGETARNSSSWRDRPDGLELV